jgi:hypothetical protein
MRSWWAMRKRRLGWWALWGILFGSLLVLMEASDILKSIETAGSQSYDASVFTGFKVQPWNSADLESALMLWRNTQPDIAGTAIRTHVLVDLFLFIPAYCFVLFEVLRRVSSSPYFARTAVGVLLVTDIVETWGSALAFGRLVARPPWVLVTIQFFSAAKWVVLAVVLVAIAITWLNPGIKPRRDYWSARDLYSHIDKARRGGPPAPGLALKWIILVVGVLALVMAAPLGGPLDQIPDVLRYQIGEDPRALFASAYVLALLVTAVAVGGSLAIAQPSSGSPNVSAHTALVLGVSLVVWIPAALVWATDSVFRWAPLSTAIVIWALAAAWVAQLSRSASTSKPKPKLDEWSEENEHAEREKATLWVGTAAGAVVLIAGLGLVRASYSVLALNLTGKSLLLWIGAFLAGSIGAVLAAWIVQSTIVWASGGLSTISRGAIAALVVGCIGLGWIVLFFWPTRAQYVGTTGVLALGLAAFALLVGFLGWVSRCWIHWGHLRHLGIQRTPWVMILITVWLVAGAINSDGGYHDARVSEDLLTSSDADRTYETLENAFAEWDLANTSSPCASDDVVPMILVAAPGGGIRAAYWTASGLERLIPESCTGAVFAVSGVSGGSLGAVTWLATMADARSWNDTNDLTPSAVAAGMSRDVGLAMATAGLLTRDVVQPLVGVTTAWNDRAALLEDGWAVSSENLFDEGQSGYLWSEIGAGLTSVEQDPMFVPVMILNGSSVTDGCRVLVSNVMSLAASSGADCFDTRQVPARGPVSGATDASPLAVSNPEPDCARLGDLRTTTAALLSARFPVISPSGAIRTCSGEADEPRTSYVVDGGYYENSLFTLLQLWSRVEQSVRMHNAMPREDGHPIIEPWIVVLDSGYKTQTVDASASRPREFLAPLAAVGNKGTAISQPALEQMAKEAMSIVPGNCEASRFDLSCSLRNGFIRINPSVRPTIDAPLGWVLSDFSRTDLDCQLEQLLEPIGDLDLRSKLAMLATPPSADTTQSECPATPTDP